MDLFGGPHHEHEDVLMDVDDFLSVPGEHEPAFGDAPDLFAHPSDLHPLDASLPGGLCVLWVA